MYGACKLTFLLISAIARQISGLFYYTSRLTGSLVLLLILLFCLCLPAAVQSQTNIYVIKVIRLEGNKKTAPEIIIQEMNIFEGDEMTIEELEEALVRNRNLILNTYLFTEVSFEKTIEGNEILLLLKVHERSIYGLAPLFELADRNFNVWWKEFGFDPERVSLGIKNRFLNIGGLADYITLTFQLGYTRKIEAAYFRPYFESSSRWGAVVKFLYTTSKQFGYDTRANLLIFNPTLDNFITNRTEANYNLSFRANRHLFQGLDFSYKRFRVDEAFIPILNPEFYADESSSQTSLNMTYKIRYDRRNFWIYPTAGYSTYFEAEKRGLGIWKDVNLLFLRLDLQYYLPLGSRVSLGWHGRFSHEVSGNEMSYFNRMALGYGEDVLRGYETFVADGRSFFISKQEARYNFWNFKIKPRRIINWKLLPEQLPFQWYAVIHSDFGYVDNPYSLQENDLQNKFLSSFGVGLDFVFRYNNVGRVHLSRTRDGLTGIYFGIKGVL